MKSKFGKYLLTALCVAITSLTFTSCDPLGDEPGNDDGNENVNGSDNDDNNSEDENTDNQPISQIPFIGSWEVELGGGRILFFQFRKIEESEIIEYYKHSQWSEESGCSGNISSHDPIKFTYEYEDGIITIYMDSGDTYYTRVLELSEKEMTITAFWLDDEPPVTLHRLTSPKVIPRISIVGADFEYTHESCDIATTHLHAPPLGGKFWLEVFPFVIYPDGIDYTTDRLLQYSAYNGKYGSYPLEISTEKRDYFSNHYYLTEVTVQAPAGVSWDYANEHILIITIKTFDGAFYKHTIDIYQGYRKNSNS